MNQYYLLPIDQCFKLVGLVRMHWRGLSGGQELWQAIEQYFAALTARAGLPEGVIMPDLDFRIESAAPVPFAAAPLLAFRIAVTNAHSGEAIFSVALRCQIQIEVTRRRYTRAGPGASARSVRRAGALGPDAAQHALDQRQRHGFRHSPGSTTVEVQVPCTFDFNVAATKYFHGIENGEIPLCFLFSGTVFYDGGDGAAAGGADLLEQGDAIPAARRNLAQT